MLYDMFVSYCVIEIDGFDCEIIIYCVCFNEVFVVMLVCMLMGCGFKCVCLLYGGIDVWVVCGYGVEYVVLVMFVILVMVEVGV